MKRSKFVVEIKEQLNNRDFLYLRNLYTPIIGVNAVSLFQVLYDYHSLNGNNNVYYELNEIASCLSLTESDLVSERKRLEAIGLIRVYEKADNIHFIIRLNKPLDPLTFKNNSLLYKEYINKQGEVAFERIYFSTKNKEYGKDEFSEVTIKYQDLFTINKPDQLQNTQMIELPSVKSIEEAKIGLTSEQFIHYLTNKRVSPLQLNTINKMKNLGLSTKSINEIINYSFTINNGKIVSGYIFTIAEDMIKQNINSYEAIVAELNNAKKNRLGIKEESQSQSSDVKADDWNVFFDMLGGN